MMRTILAPVFALLLMARAQGAPLPLPPGLYEASGRAIYVGVEHELPDPAGNDFFDPSSQRTGDLESTSGLHLRRGLLEKRHVIETPQGRLGFSLYYATGTPKPTVILIHGNDAETREMGSIIPFFVFNGVNVVSYDQRGTGQSTGNWFLNGPAQRADDVTAVYDAVTSDPRVRAHAIGVWGFSNGGWTAPLVTLRRPIAFMLLKSAASESLISNINYEVVQEMRSHGANSAQIAKALTLGRSIEGALNGTVAWSDVRTLYDTDAKQSWFKYSLIPKLGLTFPPPPQLVAGLRRALTYDPAPVLVKVTTPTLALYGTLDRRVDSADSALHMREYLAQAGNRDVTVKMYPHADHPLFVTGDNGDMLMPQRYVPGYPQIMITWLEQRGFATGLQR